jgi:sirohydrochlorin cobaltochelatase
MAPTPAAECTVTVLVARPDPGSGDALARLARRFATRLGQPVRVCRLDDRGDALPAAVERAVAGGATGVVLLPLDLGLGPEPAARLWARLSGVSARWPALALRPGTPLHGDDVARILGDRAREMLGPRAGAAAAADVVVVIAGGGGANPVANAELARLARLVYEAHRFGGVDHGFLELTTPTVGEVVRRWARLGARRLVVVPHLLFAGDAYRRLRRQVREAARATGVAVQLARPLDPHPALLAALGRRHFEAVVGPGVVRQLGHAHGHDGGLAAELEARMAAVLPPRYRDGAAVSAAPMAAAALERDADGTVAWDRTWQGFCELALAGGPPHRGSLLEPVPREEALADPERYAAVVGELARGIRMITGLDVLTDGPPGWLGVPCASEEMAIWLMRAIVVENVMARREGAVLYLPAGPRFTVDGEIKNVITAVAKTHHYWIEHTAARLRDEQR